jgi:hypothetical protein
MKEASEASVKETAKPQQTAGVNPFAKKGTVAGDKKGSGDIFKDLSTSSNP